MFQLCTGSFRRLEETFVAAVQALRRNDPLARLLVLSPSARLLTHLQTRLAHANPGYLNIHCLTFYALAERILGEGPAREDRVVPEPALYREIVHDFLEGRGDIPFSSRDQLRRGGGPVSKGLPGALAATLRDLQDSGARVVDCAQVAREGHLGDALEEAIPALELNVLMYDVLRKRGLRTGADLMRRAADRAPQSAWLHAQKAIFLYGFYDLTGVQMDLVLALAAHPDACIYFPYEAGNSDYAFAEKLLKDPAFASKNGKSVHRAPCTANEESIQKPGLPENGARGTEHAATEVWSCSGARDEIWLAAKKILELARQGVPYQEMCLAARTLDPYLGAIREVLEAHRIPYSQHADEPVGAWPLVKNARTALRAIRGPADAIWSIHTAHTIKHLKSGFPRTLDLAETERKIMEGLTTSIESLSELDVLGRPVSWARFLDVVEEKLDALRVNLAPHNNQGVQVMDVMAARGLAFRAVFLVGLNEKLFPRLIREDPFLSDDARSGLAQALGCRISRKLDGYQEERLLFALSTGLAPDHLHLSYQRSDEEGKALVTSLYLQEYMAGRGLTPRRLSRAWPEKFREVDSETLTPKEISLILNRAGQDAGSLYDKLAWDTPLYAKLLRSQNAIESFGALGPHDGLIGEKHPASMKLLQKGLSPATLKDLAECPFKIFARKVLSLDPEESPIEEGVATRAAMGTLIHEILERFYREGTMDLERAKNEVYHHFEIENPQLYRLPWQAAKDKIAILLAQFVKADLEDLKENGFVPKEFEIDLCATLDLGEKIQIRGRIDRIDLGNRGFRVVDYKTGSGGVKKGEKIETAIMKGKVFQLPIYLLLAKKWAHDRGLPEKISESAVFYDLRRPDAVEEPLEITSAFWAEHGDRFNKNIKFLVNDIQNGFFYIRPSDNRGYCSWCNFAGLCRKTHKPTCIRSENSPQRQAHEECFRS